MRMLLGADPEVFVMQEGKYVSAYGLIPGNKLDPYPVTDGAVQVDGMALEFNIAPAPSGQIFLANIRSVMAQLYSMVPGYTVVSDPVATFGSEYIQAQPEEATELGCDPDYNAWEGGAVNPKPDHNMPFRTAAGHVHIGWTELGLGRANHLEMCIALVKELDFYLGLPSLLFDTDTVRREMYGKAGAFRPKDYGVEYRVLSNAWLKHDDLVLWVFDACSQALERCSRGVFLSEKYGDISEVINTSDVHSALALIEKESIPVPKGYTNV